MKFASLLLGSLLGLALLPAHAETGTASYIPRSFHQRCCTANGERVNITAFTAAHRRHPFGTRIRVHYKEKSIIVRVNDRGPFVRGRVIDLTPSAFKALAPLSSGVIPVRLEVLGKTLALPSPKEEMIFPLL